MSKQSDNLNNYPLFYEDISSLRSSRASDKSSMSKTKESGGLNEDQLVKLREDLQSPMQDQSDSSDPLR